MTHFSRPAYRYRGYTLVEVVLSLFVFSLMMAITTQTFGAALSGYRSAKVIERNLEDAQFAINLLAKELRTSSIVNPTGTRVNSSSVKFYDHSQDTCFLYRINGTNLEVAQAVGVPDVATCGTTALITFKTVVGGISSGKFYVTSSQNLPSKRVGRVTIVLDIASGSVPHAYLQTTVSLRDYGMVW